MTSGDAASSTRGFRVHMYECEGALVVECHGNLTSENAPLLKEEVRGKIAGQKRIILDMKEVPRMDSSGLGTVATLYISGRTKGCKVGLINENEAIRDLFSMTNLLLLFEGSGRGGRIL